jgi:hypothetical protein
MELRNKLNLVQIPATCLAQTWTAATLHLSPFCMQIA